MSEEGEEGKGGGRRWAQISWDKDNSSCIHREDVGVEYFPDASIHRQLGATQEASGPGQGSGVGWVG